MAESKITKDMKEKIASVSNRISSLVDEIYLMKEDLNTFKKAVADDMKRLVNRTNKK